MSGDDVESQEPTSVEPTDCPRILQFREHSLSHVLYGNCASDWLRGSRDWALPRIGDCTSKWVRKRCVRRVISGLKAGPDGSRLMGLRAPVLCND
jgi:hypothetical protein